MSRIPSIYTDGNGRETVREVISKIGMSVRTSEIVELVMGRYEFIK